MVEALISALSRLPQETDPDHDYALAATVGVGFCGRARSRNVVLLIPVQDTHHAVVRRTAAMRVSPLQNVRFVYQGHASSEHAAVIECLDEALIQTFLALASDLAMRFPANASKPNWEDVVEVIDEWQRMLARRGKLGPERELGLWGELKFMLDCPIPERLLEHWRGPTGALIDFDGPLKVEVKTSLFEHEHETSHDQLTNLAENDGYVVSLWAEADPSGESLPDLVARLNNAVSSSPLLLRELLRAGYVTADGAAYITRYRLCTSPLWFRSAIVPRAHELDEGVFDVRFRVRLLPEAAVSAIDVSSLWSRLVSEG